MITVLFCLVFLTGNFLSYPTGGDICGEDNSEDGQDRNQRGMFRYVEPVSFHCLLVGLFEALPENMS